MTVLVSPLVKLPVVSAVHVSVGWMRLVHPSGLVL